MKTKTSAKRWKGTVRCARDTHTDFEDPVPSVKEFKLQRLSRLEKYKEVTVKHAEDLERKDREIEAVFGKTIDQDLCNIKPDTKVS
jgi:hypothetical protein